MAGDDADVIIQHVLTGTISPEPGADMSKLPVDDTHRHHRPRCWVRKGHKEGRKLVRSMEARKTVHHHVGWGEASSLGRPSEPDSPGGALALTARPTAHGR